MLEAQTLSTSAKYFPAIRSVETPVVMNMRGRPSRRCCNVM